MKLNPRDNSLRKQMLIDSFAGSMLVIAGVVGAVSYKLNGDIELLLVSLTAFIGGLGVALVGSLRKDLYDRMTDIENLLHMRGRIDKLCKH